MHVCMSTLGVGFQSTERHSLKYCLSTHHWLVVVSSSSSTSSRVQGQKACCQSGNPSQKKNVAKITSQWLANLSGVKEHKSQQKIASSKELIMIYSSKNRATVALFFRKNFC